MKIWDNETFERKMAALMNKADDGRLEMNAAIYIHGFNNQPITTFRQTDIYVLNMIVLSSIEKEIKG